MDMMQKRLIEITLEERAIDADQLGQLKARMSNDAEIADTIKARLIDTAADPQFGTRVFEGKLFRATVSFENKSNTDWRSIIKELIETSPGISEKISRLVIKHTQIAEGVPCVRTYARKA